eukprot:6197754-Pleurochrysis_carterae.AAC.2
MARRRTAAGRQRSAPARWAHPAACTSFQVMAQAVYWAGAMPPACSPSLESKPSRGKAWLAACCSVQASGC